VASTIASRISTPLVPHHAPEAAVRDELGRVLREFGDGVVRLSRTPRAIWPIGTITLDQMGQGIVLVLSLFVFRDRFESGVGSFSNLIGAGGVGSGSSRWASSRSDTRRNGSWRARSWREVSPSSRSPCS
jgi:hypothetical protein